MAVELEASLQMSNAPCQVTATQQPSRTSTRVSSRTSTQAPSRTSTRSKRVGQGLPAAHADDLQQPSTGLRIPIQQRTTASHTASYIQRESQRHQYERGVPGDRIIASLRRMQSRASGGLRSEATHARRTAPGLKAEYGLYYAHYAARQALTLTLESTAPDCYRNPVLQPCVGPAAPALAYH